VLILLPPSEGKQSPIRGPRLKMGALSHTSLNPVRAEVLDALTTLCSTSPTKARTILGLGPKQAEEVARNANLLSAATAPAIEVYTGVLFGALDAASLSAAAQKRLNTHVLISSALFGFLSPTDPIPAYRLSGDTALPGIGPLHSVWREPLSAVLEQTTSVILDLRSGAYAKLGPLPHAVADRSFVGRVMLEKNGKRTVVSHHNKATKGHLVRGLMELRTMPKTEAAMVRALEGLGYTIAIHEGNKAGQPATLEIVVTNT
jgi:cytoplasmic iron level regulating protein YaaA (DUF328/UPF0246 family)